MAAENKEKVTTADANAGPLSAAPISAGDLASPDATYSEGVPTATTSPTGVDAAIQADAPVVTTYEDALAAGYFGYAPGYANTDKMSVSAVTERDRKVGLTADTAKRGAVVNASGDNPDAIKKADATK